MQFIYHHLTENVASIDSIILPETEARYQGMMERADKTYHVTVDKMKKLTNIVLLWQSFVTRSDHLCEWIDMITNSQLKTLTDSREYDQESVVIKLMRFSELEKRAYERQRVRDRVEREAKSLIEATGNNTVSVKLDLLNQKWLNLRDHVRKERLRLDYVCKMWREFRNVYEELQQWINTCKINLQEDQRDLNSIELIEKELSIQQVSVSSLLLFVYILLLNMKVSFVITLSFRSKL